jgi:arabinan endo-1,5-alpha-L-arabinosidase
LTEAPLSTGSPLRRVAAALLTLACGSESLPGDPTTGAGGGGDGGTPSVAGASGATMMGGIGARGGVPSSDGGEPNGTPEAGAAGIDGEGGQASAGAPSALPPEMLELNGAFVQVHDPAIVKDGDTFYLFSTGVGVSVRTSSDLVSWKGAGSVFSSKPSWITTTDPGNPNHLWAPEVLYFGGKFHLYYSASRFGSNRSCIGHATRARLGSGAGWVEQGEPIICSNEVAGTDDFNAIDPNPFQDEEGKLWLSFGSFWGGIKLIRLDADGRRDGPDLFSLATRDNTAVEAPHLFYHGGYYYLFESVDSCCQGAASTYKTMVGRSKSVTGPYLDAAGDALSDGGGTLLVEGGARFRGPGHNAILLDQGQHYNIFHAYDADSSGVPTLRIAQMGWNESGWPISAGP